MRLKSSESSDRDTPRPLRPEDLPIVNRSRNVKNNNNDGISPARPARMYAVQPDLLPARNLLECKDDQYL